MFKLTFSYLKFNLKPTSKSLKTAGTRSPVFKTIISPGTNSLASKEWISPFLILEFSNFKKYILFWLIQKDEAISQLFQEHAGSIRFKKIRCKARIYTWLMWLMARSRDINHWNLFLLPLLLLLLIHVWQKRLTTIQSFMIWYRKLLHIKTPILIFYMHVLRL